MKTLYILRHAKSSWEDPDLADFDRPLNARGLSAAPFMGDLIAAKGYEPSIILCSPAERAKQTAELVTKHAGIGAKIQFDPRVYEASPNALRQVVSEIDDSIDSAMLVGHNPGIEGFIRYLTNEIEAMPTAALAVINTEIDSWGDINAGCGTLTTVYRPKDEAAKQDI
ncbi:histidine phosphatase family protein [soil metagenome]